MSKYVKITKDEFDSFMSRFKHWELELSEYVIVRNNFDYTNDFQEYCYVINIYDMLLVLVFSSVDMKTGKTRDNSKDAIRLVPVLADLGKISGFDFFPHMKRVTGWRDNFAERIMSIVETDGHPVKCGWCDKKLVLRRNGKSGKHFLGCSGYSGGCGFSYGF
jgi:hypothetical protein